MGKVLRLALVMFSISFISYVTYISISKEKIAALKYLSLKSVESLSRIEDIDGGELPGVEITCGSEGTKGPCWQGDCEPFYTPFGFGKAWDCYIPTGNPNDVCVQDAPCI